MGCVSLNPKFQYIQYSSTREEMPPEEKFTLVSKLKKFLNLSSNKVAGWLLQTLLKCTSSHNNFKDFVSILIYAWQLFKNWRTMLNVYF